MAQNKEYLQQFFQAIRDERGLSKNTATRIGTAFLLLLDYLAAIEYPYLRNDIADTAKGHITLLRGLTADLQSHFKGLDFTDVLKTKDAVDGFGGKGITMTAGDGKIQADALEVRGWMRVAKLVYNMIQVMEQDYQFSGGGDIEDVEDNSDGTYTLHIHKEKAGRHVSFADFDILYGKVDEPAGTAAARPGEQPAEQGGYDTGTDEGTGTEDGDETPDEDSGGETVEDFGYYTCWVRVCENGVTLNDGLTPDTVRVEMWEDRMVPGGRNFPPKKLMTVARRGNTRDGERQAFWELSTTDHRITHYWRVDQPKLRADNYALCLGILPTILDDAGVLPRTRDKEMPSLYVNTIFYENAHQIYYPSRIVKVDRGEWTEAPKGTYTGVDGTYTHDGTLDDDSLATEVQEGRMTAADADRLKVIRTWGGAYATDQEIDEPYHFESFSRNMWLTHRLSPSHASLTDLEVWQKMTTEWHVDKETSRTWRYSSLWECLREGTEEAPGISHDWALISGLQMRLDFVFDRGTLVWVDDVKLRAEARILLGTEDVTDEMFLKEQDGEVAMDWTWERMSNEDGTKTADDALWQPVMEKNHPNVLLIDHCRNISGRRTDCGPLWEKQLRVWFKCTVNFSTGHEAEGELGLG